VPLPTWIPDLESLDLLLSVAELGSVGKAGHAHGISQPAASAKLHRLERQVGLALLTRTPTGSTLTPVGHAFVTWAREVVLAASSLGENVTALRQSRSAKLRIAASLTVAEYLLPQWLLVLRRQNPTLDVSAVVANSHDVCDRVRAAQVDLGFVEMPTVPPDLTHRQVGTDELAFVAAPDYPAARRRTALRPADLITQPVLLREVGSGTRETFIHALAAAMGNGPTVDLPHAIELGSTTTILATARAGGGIGVISARAANVDLHNAALAELTVSGLTATRPLNAVWLGAAPSPSAALLIEVAGRGGR
jgi:DNA-binding transcriptional LysR family regulator